MLNPFTPKNNQTETKQSMINNTTIDTIQLMGKQVLELRSVVDEQSSIIRELITELQRIKNINKEHSDDMTMLKIDQKDISKQVRMIKESVPMEKLSDLGLNQDNSFEEIAKAVYPGYNNSQLFQEQNNNQEEILQKIKKQYGTQKEVQSSSEDQTMDFIFGRIPKLLNLDH